MRGGKLTRKRQDSGRRGGIWGRIADKAIISGSTAFLFLINRNLSHALKTGRFKRVSVAFSGILMMVD